MSSQENIRDSSEQSNLLTPRKLVTAGVMGVLLIAGAIKGEDMLHDHNHPALAVGDTHDDVKALGELLEDSELSTYESTGGRTFTRDLLTALEKYQEEFGLPDNQFGRIREGDATWKSLEENQVEEPPEGLPSECYAYKDVICVDKDDATHFGELYVLHGGDLKFSIDTVGVGRAGYETPAGDWSIEPDRMYEYGYTSSQPEAHNAAMPLAMFFDGGKAIHMSPTLAETGEDYPGSLGCITIGGRQDARALYDYTAEVFKDGDRVMRVVVGNQ